MLSLKWRLPVCKNSALKLILETSWKGGKFAASRVFKIGYQNTSPKRVKIKIGVVSRVATISGIFVQ